jgi:hypothetical protein
MLSLRLILRNSAVERNRVYSRTELPFRLDEPKESFVDQNYPSCIFTPDPNCKVDVNRDNERLHLEPRRTADHHGSFQRTWNLAVLSEKWQRCVFFGETSRRLLYRQISSCLLSACSNLRRWESVRFLDCVFELIISTRTLDVLWSCECRLMKLV